MSTVVSFRLPKRVRREMEEMGLDPSRFSREAVLDALRKEKARRSLAWIREHRIKGLERSSVELIREDRESH